MIGVQEGPKAPVIILARIAARYQQIAYTRRCRAHIREFVHGAVAMLVLSRRRCVGGTPPDLVKGNVFPSFAVCCLPQPSHKAE